MLYVTCPTVCCYWVGILCIDSHQCVYESTQSHRCISDRCHAVRQADHFSQRTLLGDLPRLNPSHSAPYMSVPNTGKCRPLRCKGPPSVQSQTTICIPLLPCRNFAITRTRINNLLFRIALRCFHANRQDKTGQNTASLSVQSELKYSTSFSHTKVCNMQLVTIYRAT